MREVNQYPQIIGWKDHVLKANSCMYIHIYMYICTCTCVLYTHIRAFIFLFIYRHICTITDIIHGSCLFLSICLLMLLLLYFCKLDLQRYRVSTQLGDGKKKRSSHRWEVASLGCGLMWVAPLICLSLKASSLNILLLEDILLSSWGW